MHPTSSERCVRPAQVHHGLRALKSRRSRRRPSLRTYAVPCVACTCSSSSKSAVGVSTSPVARRTHRSLGRSTGAQPQLHRPSRADALLIHDHDSKFSASFDEIFHSESITVIRTPIRAPQANAYAERFVRTVRTECLDRLLIVGRRHLERVLRIYIQHYNRERPHPGLALQSPEPLQVKQAPGGDVRRRDRLGGLVHEYYRAAA
jgi:hypothetical protein